VVLQVEGYWGCRNITDENGNDSMRVGREWEQESHSSTPLGGFGEFGEKKQRNSSYFAFFSTEFDIALKADYVTVVEDRPIIDLQPYYLPGQTDIPYRLRSQYSPPQHRPQ